MSKVRAARALAWFAAAVALLSCSQPVTGTAVLVESEGGTRLLEESPSVFGVLQLAALVAAGVMCVGAGLLLRNGDRRLPLYLLGAAGLLSLAGGLISSLATALAFAACYRALLPGQDHR